jgi:type II secretory pathway component PulK
MFYLLHPFVIYLLILPRTMINISSNICKRSAATVKVAVLLSALSQESAAAVISARGVAATIQVAVLLSALLQESLAAVISARGAQQQYK